MLATRTRLISKTLLVHEILFSRTQTFCLVLNDSLTRLLLPPKARQGERDRERERERETERQRERDRQRVTKRERAQQSETNSTTLVKG